MAQTTKGKEKKKRSVWFAPLSFIIVCAAIVFAVSVFFSITKIEVNGASEYTPEEVISASELETGDNLFFVNRFAATSRIYSKLPYIESCVIDRKLPNTLILNITETVAVAACGSEGSFWVFDKYCKLLFETDNSGLSGIIKIRGVEPEAPVVGERLASSTVDDYALEYIKALLIALSDKGIISNVSEIDFSNPSNPEMEYMGRFTVKMGTSEETEAKLDRLQFAVSQLTEYDIGTIDLSIDNNPHFIQN